MAFYNQNIKLFVGV